MRKSSTHEASGTRAAAALHARSMQGDIINMASLWQGDTCSLSPQRLGSPGRHTHKGLVRLPVGFHLQSYTTHQLLRSRHSSVLGSMLPQVGKLRKLLAWDRQAYSAGAVYNRQTHVTLLTD